jgi:hypothetical protein
MTLEPFVATHTTQEEDMTINEPNTPRPRWRWGRAKLVADEEGAATAEYAIATMAAVGFAGLLVVILRSNEVRGLLLGIIRSALSI